MKDKFDAIEVNTTVENVRRLGKFDKERLKPRSVLVTVPNCWDALKILAKASKKRNNFLTAVSGFLHL